MGPDTSVEDCGAKATQSTSCRSFRWRTYAGSSSLSCSSHKRVRSRWGCLKPKAVLLPVIVFSEVRIWFTCNTKMTTGQDNPSHYSPLCLQTTLLMDESSAMMQRPSNSTCKMFSFTGSAGAKLLALKSSLQELMIWEINVSGNEAQGVWQALN